MADCEGCKKALRAALKTGQDPQKLKTRDGHIEGCEHNAEEQYWPWAEPKHPLPVHGTGAQAQPAEPPHIHHRPDNAEAAQRGQQRRISRARPGRQPVPDQCSAPDQGADDAPLKFKRVDHSTAGEKRDLRKGMWFITFCLIAMLVTPVFPPVLLVCIGAIICLFVVK